MEWHITSADIRLKLARLVAKGRAIDLADIISAGEASAAQVAKMPRKQLIRRVNGMDEKHTPGPWVVSKIGLMNDGSRPIVTDDIRVAIACSVTEPTKQREAWRHCCAEREANARLIAAAPDMLKALRMIVAYDNMVDADGVSVMLSYVDALDAVHDAIAKAEGVA